MKNYFGTSMLISFSIIVAATFSRYEIQIGTMPGINGGVLFRIDRLTGTIEACLPWVDYLPDDDIVLDQPKWCKAVVQTGEK